MADVLTDFVQAIAVILGLIILAVVVAGETGGFAAGLAQVEPHRLAYFSADDRGILERLEEWAVPIFSTMVAVELIARILGTNSARIRCARGSVIVLGLIAFVIALRSTTIHDLVETASAIGSAGLIVVALFGLFTRFGGPAVAASALVTGAVVWLAGGRDILALLS